MDIKKGYKFGFSAKLKLLFIKGSRQRNYVSDRNTPKETYSVCFFGHVSLGVFLCNDAYCVLNLEIMNLLSTFAYCKLSNELLYSE